MDIKETALAPAVITWKKENFVCQQKQACMLLLPFDKSHDTVPLKLDIKETAQALAVII